MEYGICSPDRKLIVGNPTNNPQDDQIGDLKKAIPKDADEGISSLDF
jgi:hypothetical protein